MKLNAPDLQQRRAQLMLAIVGAILAIVGWIALLKGQAPSFDVASVKPNTAIDGRRNGMLAPGQFSQTWVTLRQLIQMAYRRRGFDARQIAGGPGWIDSDRFDVTAKGDFRTADYLPDAAGSPGRVYQMLQNLLTVRFRLRVHTESREVPAYALVMARAGRLGPRLRLVNVDCAAVGAAVARGERPPASPDPNRGPICAARTAPGLVAANSLTIPQFADLVSSSLDRVVVDRTGLSGVFDIDLKWTPDQRSVITDAAPGAFANDAVLIVTALQDQLGLRLESVRAPIAVLVIEGAERPTPD